MSGRVLMVQGTMSSVGKSLLVAALCRIFRQDGWHVAPFKAQNMALNSFATRDGREVGRAQAMQAEAAGVDVTVDMNPVLIKPEADSFSQVVVLGEAWDRLAARSYYRRRSELWPVVTAALERLRQQHDLVIIEGAGSPVELNLKRGDMVNMAIARHASAPVLLAGDIDRGGIFAQLLGTLMLFDAAERALVRGLIVNRFRGDRTLFTDGVGILEERGGVPVLGVVPFIPNLGIADEDSVALETRPVTAPPPTNDGTDPLDIAVIRLPRISNFDDFDPLRAEPGVTVRFVAHTSDLHRPDLIILPGTKTTIADLAYLRQSGLAERIAALAGAGVAVLGICGGYQMLGRTIHDPHAVESDVPHVNGLNLLPVDTTFAATKQTVRASGTVVATSGLFAGLAGSVGRGYEIHMGRTVLHAGAAPLLHITTRGDGAVDDGDGAVAAGGWIAGTYLHGLFDNDALRHALLHNLAARKGLSRAQGGVRFERDAAYDRLASEVRQALDMARLAQIIPLTGDG
jgi:adenosylcobyric acid synthase